MELFQVTIVTGVVIGLIYAISGAGLVVIYRTSGYVSFAQGDVAAVSLFVGLAMYKAGVPYPLMALATIVIGGVVGALIGGLVVVPLERHGVLTAALATVAVGLIIQSLENMTVGAAARTFPSAGDGSVLQLGSVNISRANLLSLAAATVVFVLLGVAFRKLQAGIAMRAINDNPEAANILGIPASALRLLSWLIAGMLAGLSGLFVVSTYSLSPTSVNALLMYSFAAIVLGGFESIVGALVGGIVIGVGGNLAGAYLDPNLTATAIFVMLMTVLLIRPNGIFGRRPLVRV